MCFTAFVCVGFVGDVKSFPQCAFKNACYYRGGRKDVIIMMTKDRIALNQILAHKEYFDQRLVEINESLIHQTEVLKATNMQLKGSCQESQKKIRVLQQKAQDLENQKNEFQAQYQAAKKEKEDLYDILKDVQNELDKLKRDNEKQIQEIKKQRKEIEKQKTEMDKLKHMNSTNSSLPPSTDILGHTQAKAQANTREKTERKKGGQVNHPVHRSQLKAQPDRIVKVKVKKAPAGAEPRMDETGTPYYAVQEIDAQLKTIIIETHYYLDADGIDLAEGIMKKYQINNTAYSNALKAQVLYLNGKGIIALERLSTMLYEMSGQQLDIQPSTMVKWEKELHKKSEDWRKEVLERLLSSRVLHVDETGMGLHGKLGWAHTITDGKDVIYFITAKRLDLEKGPIPVLQGYNGIITHDHFVSYYKHWAEKTHAECNAHILRYLKAGEDFYHSEACAKMEELLKASLKKKQERIEQGQKSLSPAEIEAIRNQYHHIIERELKQYYVKNPKIARKYVPEYIKTLERMKKYEEEHLRFLTDFRVPFTNNHAENTLRFLKMKKKISGQFDNEQSGIHYMTLSSVIQTATRNKQNVLKELENILSSK